jgi:hypothetical protein
MCIDSQSPTNIGFKKFLVGNLKKRRKQNKTTCEQFYGLKQWVTKQ